MPKLIVISAPSGAGKTTLCNKLLEDFDELVLSISSTTRPPRSNEKHGQHYFFVPKADFEKLISSNGFAEWAQVHDNYYGTSKQTIDQAFAKGKSVLLDIDVQGAASLRKSYPRECVSIFISPPSAAELEKRLRARGTDDEKTIQKRLVNAKKEMDQAHLFNYVLINDALERSYQELATFIHATLRGPSGGKN
ncbi:MAG: guanylate kinase [Bdellovibrionota bacterium]